MGTPSKIQNGSDVFLRCCHICQCFRKVEIKQALVEQTLLTVLPPAVPPDAGGADCSMLAARV